MCLETAHPFILQRNPSLKIAYEGVTAFSTMLKINKGLRKVRFGVCNLRDREIEVLVGGLGKNTTVNSTDLQCNCFGDEAGCQGTGGAGESQLFIDTDWCVWLPIWPHQCHERIRGIEGKQ